MKNTQSKTAIRLVYIVTHPMTAFHLMKGQLAFMRTKGIEVVLITSPGAQLDMVRTREAVETRAIPIEREIHPFKDLITLIRLYKTLRKLKPEIVNASTPKAGFLGMLAAWMAGVPLRVYTLRGLRLETKKGPVRTLLSFTERIASTIAQRVICVSESLKARYLELGLVTQSKIIVLGAGSSNGIDGSQYVIEDSGEREAIREKLGIPVKSPVIGFSGRLTNDKGIHELVETFELLLVSFPDLHLIILGEFEDADPVNAEYVKKVQEHRQIIKQGFVKDPALLYRAMDVLVFASHREGFPNAPLEAAASGVPSVGFHVTGTMDAIQDGVTGKLVRDGDVEAMVDAIAMYLKDDDLRKEHGRKGRERVLQSFRQEQIWEALYSEYMDLIPRYKIQASEPSHCVPS